MASNKNAVTTAVLLCVVLSLTGCTALFGEPATIRCSSETRSDGEAVISGFTATGHDESVYLVVPAIPEQLDRFNVSRIAVYDRSGDLEYDIPVREDSFSMNKMEVSQVSDGEIPFVVNIGEAPQHSWYRVVVYNGSGGTVQTTTGGFNCYSDKSLSP
ncbi:hypothetical protein ACFR9U_15975 [Halorientalis brevis]|uniref:Lipoprotein n=1 Tax=Halorientalis brevis TaxID=1126241 RepID=A0ABD6CE30_9EURY|nr:hypothetical protein [Halorientalis brevis]